MAEHHEELLASARLLLKREPGQRGRLASARIRRSLSTSYYVLFAFIQSECARRIVGTDGALRTRRNVVLRVLTHAGIKRALGKASGRLVATDVQDLLRPAAGDADVAPPAFVRELAQVFALAQDQRISADYDLAASPSELEAKLLIMRVRRVIRTWKRARGRADNDFKHALSLLIFLGGQLRRDDGR